MQVIVAIETMQVLELMNSFYASMSRLDNVIENFHWKEKRKKEKHRIGLGNDDYFNMKL